MTFKIQFWTNFSLSDWANLQSCNLTTVPCHHHHMNQHNWLPCSHTETLGWSVLVWSQSGESQYHNLKHIPVTMCYTKVFQSRENMLLSDRHRIYNQNVFVTCIHQVYVKVAQYHYRVAKCDITKIKIFELRYGICHNHPRHQN